MYYNLRDLKEGRSTIVPKWVRGHYPPEQKVLFPTDVIIVEGFRLLYDERVRQSLDYKIYVEVPAEEIVKRRVARLRHGKADREWYYREIVVSEDIKYGLSTKKYADEVVDGTASVKSIVEKLQRTILRKLL